MSHHAEKQQLKGEQHAESLIEKILHKEKTMQDSNQDDDIHNHWDSEDHEDIHHTLNSKYNDDSSPYNSDDEENVYGSGNEEQLDDKIIINIIINIDKHHKQNHKRHHKQHHKHHDRQHYNPDEEPMNTMNDDSMYMLKSESVPLLPACPQTTACPRKNLAPYHALDVQITILNVKST